MVNNSTDKLTVKLSDKLDSELEVKLQHQLDLEREMSRRGVTNYRVAVSKSKQQSRETSMLPINHLLKSAIAPVTAGILEFIAQANTGKAGRRHAAVKYLKQINPEAAALITCRIILDRITSQDTKETKVCTTIGRGIEDELRFMAFEKQEKKYFAALDRNLSQSSSHRRRVLIHSMNKMHVEWQSFSISLQLHIGNVLLSLFREKTGLIERVVHYKGYKTFNHVQATQETLEWIENSHARAELMSPTWLPMVVPPAPWTDVYTGGYLSQARMVPIAKVFGNNKNLLEEMQNNFEDMRPTVDALNAIQATPWRVNTAVLDFMSYAWENDLELGKLPRKSDIELPVRVVPADLKKEDMTDEQRVAFRDWGRTASKIYDKNNRNMSKRLAMEKCLAAAREFRNEDEIYFPHQLCFRGRAYPIPAFLNPQGDDRAKALLTLARGKVLDNNGAFWLAVHGANVYGVDKVSLDDRANWVESNWDNIVDTVENTEHSDWWQKADKPWQFLAWCLEWIGYKQDPKNFISTLPIALDGSCNGLQHYAAALRSERLGSAVNLVPLLKPADIYQRVADVTIDNMKAELKALEQQMDLGSLTECMKVQRELAIELRDTPRTEEERKEYLRRKLNIANDNVDRHMCKRWLAWGLTRTDTKKSVMVVPYSGTQHSCRKYILEQMEDRIEAEEKNGERKCPFTEEELNKACDFMTKRIWAAIGEEIDIAAPAMQWLSKVAKMMANRGLPITWTTPAGFICQQAYRETKDQRVKTMFGDQIQYHTLRKDQEGLSVKRAASGIAPNFTHGNDAAHMFLSVNKAMEYGVRDFAMIHDSYGTIAQDCEILFQALRAAFVEMYEEHDVFEDFHKRIELALGEEVEAPPRRGKLDLSGVVESDFFFA